MAAVIAIALVMALDSPAADARTLRVERDGSGDFVKLQAAADAAAWGDTILVGPGRYPETDLFTFPGFSVQVCMGVDVDNLTIRGTDRDQVIIGPTQPSFVGEGPKGLTTKVAIHSVRVEDLTFENLFDGLYLPGGTASVRNCMFRGCDDGVVGFHSTMLSVSDATFTQNRQAIYVAPPFGPAGGVELASCTFRDNVATHVAIDSATRVAIRDCQFVTARVGVQVDNSPATIERCRFEDVRFFGIAAIAGADVLIQDNTILGGDAGIEVSFGAHAVAYRNLVQGSRFSPVFFSSFGRAEMHGNDFLSAGPWLAYAESYGAPPPITLDLTGNYWGVDDAAEIAARVHDGHDDPLVRAFVEFEPFELGSVPAQTESFGGLKARFGGHE